MIVVSVVMIDTTVFRGEFGLPQIRMMLGATQIHERENQCEASAMRVRESAHGLVDCHKKRHRTNGAFGVRFATRER